MAVINGFELVQERDIPEINSKARLFRHLKTGAQVLSLENEDENKAFGVTFRTPAPNSTGVPHILEHAVLSGSRKYPVKELFAELMKGSMATFLNAMTGPDRTMYPVASQNLQDFYNLVDVYLDVVFFPLLERETLMQEGWHHELEDMEDELVYRGVVFNEMKGAYSSPEGLLFRNRLPNLFPDTSYRFDSGGDPTVIPDLTYADFQRFHETYYHPSNAQIFFSGNDDPKTRLKILSKYLDQFDALEVDSAVALGAPFDTPRSAREPYPVEPGDDNSKSYIMVSWALPEAKNIELTFALQVMAHVLMGTAASPLRKALIDSGLGENAIGGSVSTWSRQMVFDVGMKGIDLENAQAVESLIVNTLKALVADGIDPKTIEASLNTIEFQLREFNTGGLPQGLAMMFFSLGTWVHDGDPMAPLAFQSSLNHVKEQAQNRGYFESLIETYLLDNTHRSTVVLVPDQELNDRLRKEEKARLDKERLAMGEAHLRQIVEDTRLLKELQQTPNSPEQLDSLPLLSLSDIDREIQITPLEEQDLNGVKALYHDLFTNGIFYIDLAFDLSSLPQDLIPYLSLFGQALMEMGTDKENFVEFIQRIGSKTGGIGSSRMSGQIWESDHATFWFVLRGKSTVDRVPDMMDILKDMALSINFDDKERFRQFATKAKAAKETSLIPGGMGVILERMEAGYNLPGWFDEITGGVDQLFFLRELLDNLDSQWEYVRAAFEQIYSLLFAKANLLVNITVDHGNWLQVRSAVQSFVDALPLGSNERRRWTPVLRPMAEGLMVPSQVNYVGKALNIYELGYQHHGSINVISKSLRINYLYNRIRVQGGAYSMTMRFGAATGMLLFGSYRDPNLVNTLRVYDGLPAYLRGLEMSDKELTQAIIGAIGSMDQYQLPDAKGYASMMRYLVGYNDEVRQQIRDEVLNTRVSDFRQFGEAIQDLAVKGVPVILGSSEAIRSADQELGLGLKFTKVL